jgi:Panthothenate synthetase
LDEDLAKLNELNVDHVYVPDVHDLYPAGPRTTVKPGLIASKLEGQYRPHFFDGVATVVNKLISGLGPDIAIFGEKDFQQLMVVREMVEDCRLPCQIVGAPTMREDDGLAMSSRNQYLDQEERAKAVGLHATLLDLRSRLRSGSLPVAQAPVFGAQMLLQSGFEKVDYVNLVDLPDLDNARTYKPGQRLLAAAWLGSTRLIDNIEV